MKDLKEALAEEERFRYLLEKFEECDDPIVAELKARIIGSAKNCPYDKETCPYIHHANKQ